MPRNQAGVTPTRPPCDVRVVAAALTLCTLLVACERPTRDGVPSVPRVPRSEPASSTTSASTTPSPGVATASPTGIAPHACPAGFADCGDAVASGCTTDLDRDPSHCGACGAACAEGTACVGGACRTEVIGVSAGGSHTCAWKASGRALCWGLNGGGQLGMQGGKARLTPAEVTAVRDATRVAAGRYSACVLRRTGEVACWGAAALGRPSGAATNTRPASVADVEHAIDIATGRGHACALRRTGGVACWGANAASQLGAASFGSGGAPHVAPGITNAIAIAAGGAHTCVVTQERHVRCWGSNRFGQLGIGTIDEPHAAAEPIAGVAIAHRAPPERAPADVAGLTDVVRVSLGGFHSCAVTRAGELYCWGHDDAGQLGLGDRTDRALPARVALEGVADVSAGERHTCARLRSGDAYCWGAGEGGRLGDGASDDRESPVKVAGIAHAIAVSAGDMHTCALDADGRIWCWGVNDGQLGDGTTEEQHAPVQVKLPATGQ